MLESWLAGAAETKSTTPQPPAITIWDGVFTREQAERGERVYEVRCARCHGEDLRGGSGRALVGTAFWQDWGEDELQSFYRLVRATMPRDAPGRLAAGEYVDVVAFVLAANGLPSGANELTEDRLPDIRITERDGPGGVPNFSLVQVVGCLGRDSRGQWILEKATDPVRNRNPTAPPDVKAAETAALGALRFRLLSPPPSQVESALGHRVQVNGVLIRAADDDQLNVVSVTTIATECGAR